VDVKTSVGSRGQFDLFIDGEKVVTKRSVSLLSRLLGDKGFPDEATAVAAVRAHLGRE
jgi:hypothetical protein